MKLWQKTVVLLALTSFTVTVSSSFAEDAAAPAPVPAAPAAPMPQLSYGEAQILQLTQAKISDETIIAYIKNSPVNYNLQADQIIYLRQQGVSDGVITIMLNQPRAVASAPVPATYTPPPMAAVNPPQVVTSPAPSVTYIQSAPAPTYYYTQPYYYSSPYYYSDYGYYPPVSLSFGWGWGWGGGWRGGGWRGGGGGWHGGGGGWHGGGGHR